MLPKHRQWQRVTMAEFLDSCSSTNVWTVLSMGTVEFMSLISRWLAHQDCETSDQVVRRTRISDAQEELAQGVRSSVASSTKDGLNRAPDRVAESPMTSWRRLASAR